MSWIQTAKPGDRVICLNDRGFSDVIQAGKEYAIRGIYEDDGLIFVALVGVNERSETYGWFPSRFRPVTPRNTDIAWAHDILRKVGKPVTEAA